MASKEEKEEEKLEDMSPLRQLQYQLAGGDPDEHIGNMWGWRFSIISLIGITLMGGFIGFLYFTGRLDMEKQNKPIRNHLPAQVDSLYHK